MDPEAAPVFNTVPLTSHPFYFGFIYGAPKLLFDESDIQKDLNKQSTVDWFLSSSTTTCVVQWLPRNDYFFQIVDQKGWLWEEWTISLLRKIVLVVQMREWTNLSSSRPLIAEKPHKNRHFPKQVLLLELLIYLTAGLDANLSAIAGMIVLGRSRRILSFYESRKKALLLHKLQQRRVTFLCFCILYFCFWVLW